MIVERQIYAQYASVYNCSPWLVNIFSRNKKCKIYNKRNIFAIC